ncbi:hypothetical protein GJ496_008296 [Pomphorhynchus laevis]|nr:hypothetical protein GJ496_008296 [Pomphorhynchus laevis]
MNDRTAAATNDRLAAVVNARDAAAINDRTAVAANDLQAAAIYYRTAGATHNRLATAICDRITAETSPNHIRSQCSVCRRHIVLNVIGLIHKYGHILGCPVTGLPPSFDSEVDSSLFTENCDSCAIEDSEISLN